MAKQLERVEGLVELTNPRGIRLVGGPEWLNVSQYHPLAHLPIAGHRVDVQVERTDRGAWIQSVEVLDDGVVHELPARQRRGGSARSPAELRDIRRLSVLKAAAAFAACRADLKSAEVLAIADRWLAWIERPERKEAPIETTRAIAV